MDITFAGANAIPAAETENAMLDSRIEKLDTGINWDISLEPADVYFALSVSCQCTYESLKDGTVWPKEELDD
jgi:hypothetical protein